MSQVYRNDGGGVFTDIGAALTGGRLSSVAWGDYDNDGDLDILLTGDTGSAGFAKVYRNDGGGVFTDVGENLPAVEEIGRRMGRLRQRRTAGHPVTGGSAWYRSGAVSTANTAPGTPTNLSAIVGAGQVTLSWTASSDAETPAAGLTYNVRVGTTAGGTSSRRPCPPRRRATAASCNSETRASARRR